MSSVIRAGAGVLGLSLSGRVVMLPLAPLVTGSGDNHVILADHIAAIRAAGGHGLRTVLIAGGIHNVAFQSLRIMRRGGQLSSEGGVCGDGRRGGIGIPSIAVVAGSIGSLGGQSRYRSGALALFHSLGAQRSAVLGHIVNGVRLGLRRAGATDLQSTHSRSGALILGHTGYSVHTIGVNGTHVQVAQTGVVGRPIIHAKLQQVVGNHSAFSNLETNGTQIQALQLNAQLIIAAQGAIGLKSVVVANIHNGTGLRQMRSSDRQSIISVIEL